MIPWTRISCSTGSVALLAAALVSVASGDVAYAELVSCPAGSVCMWDQTNYQGRKWEVTEPIDGLVGAEGNAPAPCFTPLFVANSIQNWTSKVVQIFEGSECRGRILGLARPPGVFTINTYPTLTFRSIQFCAYPVTEASKCYRSPG